MKSITLIILILLILTATACTIEKNEIKNEVINLNWLTNLEEAQKISQEKGIPIFVDFTGSDWCGWCFRLRDEIFSQEEFIQYAKENLVLLKLDFPRKIKQSKETKLYNENLARRFGIRGLPTILLVNSKGEEIARTGYQYGGAENYINHIRKLLSNK
ncbi:MAG: thioredoxin family protein [Candidatus Cloacimonetes bacterium]|nr:thioredoxin family protein [Candidatus Cloacimonadota bacterium]